MTDDRPAHTDSARTELVCAGRLRVADRNELYFETVGNADGPAVLWLHGGPGGGIGTGHRSNVDPDRQLSISFDQRGCGRSRPLVTERLDDIDTNTTPAQIKDIEALREHLGVDRWLVTGSSWGSTLALAYAQAHPERVTGVVLAAVTTTSTQEVEWITESMGMVFPEEWERFAGSVDRLPGAAFDCLSIVQRINAAHTFRDAGAATYVVSAEDKIDPVRCDALARIPGVTGSGAFRAGRPLTLSAAPGTGAKSLEISAGLSRLLSPAAHERGVLLDSTIATTLGARVGTDIATSLGPTRLAGTYEYPDDGRDRLLAYAVMAPTAATTAFDGCVMSMWPVSDATSTQLLWSVDVTAGTDRPSVRQLNTTLGRNYDSAASNAASLGAWSVYVAAAWGFGLGALSMRMRRLEIASALHAGLPRAQLTLGYVGETFAWALAGSLLALPVVLWAAIGGNPDPTRPVVITGLRTLAVGVATALLGAAMTALVTKERRLFTYFKIR